jgi:lysozyme
MSLSVQQSEALETELRAWLKQDESVRLFVYDDATGLPIRPGTLVKGHPTIGTGRALDVNGISPPENDFLLGDDIARVTNALDQALPWYGGLNTVRQAALGNMAVNLGVHGLISFHNTLTHMQMDEWKQAADELRASHWYTQVGARAERIAKAIETGVAA